MCFSPEADFAAAAVVGVVGVETLRRVRDRRELVIGLLPLLFATHQLVEGFVWLGLRGQVASSLGNAARDAYVIYAHAILPMIVPIGFLLIEPSRTRRHALRGLVALGLAVGGYLLWQVTQYPIQAEEHAHCIAYSTHTPLGTEAAVAYIVATCAPALLSSRRYLRWFGVASIFGIALTIGLRDADFTSVWCIYAALVSVLILEHFRRARAEPRAPTSRPPVPAGAT
jgi:hypothetical protein